MSQSSISSSSYESYDSEEEATWLEKFLANPSFDKLLINVPTSYFEESLSLYGLEHEIKYFKEAFNLIMYNHNEGTSPQSKKAIENAASVLYARAH